LAAFCRLSLKKAYIEIKSHWLSIHFDSLFFEEAAAHIASAYSVLELLLLDQMITFVQQKKNSVP